MSISATDAAKAVQRRKRLYESAHVRHFDAVATRRQRRIDVIKLSAPQRIAATIIKAATAPPALTHRPLSSRATIGRYDVSHSLVEPRAPGGHIPRAQRKPIAHVTAAATVSSRGHHTDDVKIRKRVPAASFAAPQYAQTARKRARDMIRSERAPREEEVQPKMQSAYTTPAVKMVAPSSPTDEYRRAQALSERRQRQRRRQYESDQILVKKGAAATFVPAPTIPRRQSEARRLSLLFPNDRVLSHRSRKAIFAYHRAMSRRRVNNDSTEDAATIIKHTSFVDAILRRRDTRRVRTVKVKSATIDDRSYNAHLAHDVVTAKSRAALMPRTERWLDSDSEFDDEPYDLARPNERSRRAHTFARTERSVSDSEFDRVMDAEELLNINDQSLSTRTSSRAYRFGYDERFAWSDGDLSDGDIRELMGADVFKAIEPNVHSVIFGVAPFDSAGLSDEEKDGDWNTLSAHRKDGRTTKFSQSPRFDHLDELDELAESPGPTDYNVAHNQIDPHIPTVIIGSPPAHDNMSDDDYDLETAETSTSNNHLNVRQSPTPSATYGFSDDSDGESNSSRSPRRKIVGGYVNRSQYTIPRKDNEDPTLEGVRRTKTAQQCPGLTSPAAASATVDELFLSIPTDAGGRSVQMSKADRFSLADTVDRYANLDVNVMHRRRVHTQKFPAEHAEKKHDSSQLELNTQTAIGYVKPHIAAAGIFNSNDNQPFLIDRQGLYNDKCTSKQFNVLLLLHMINPNIILSYFLVVTAQLDIQYGATDGHLSAVSFSSGKSRDVSSTSVLQTVLQPKPIESSPAQTFSKTSVSTTHAVHDKSFLDEETHPCLLFCYCLDYRISDNDNFVNPDRLSVLDLHLSKSTRETVRSQTQQSVRSTSAEIMSVLTPTIPTHIPGAKFSQSSTIAVDVDRLSIIHPMRLRNDPKLLTIPTQNRFEETEQRLSQANLSSNSYSIGAVTTERISSSESFPIEYPDRKSTLHFNQLPVNSHQFQEATARTNLSKGDDSRDFSAARSNPVSAVQFNKADLIAKESLPDRLSDLHISKQLTMMTQSIAGTLRSSSPIATTKATILQSENTQHVQNPLKPTSKGQIIVNDLSQPAQSTWTEPLYLNSTFSRSERTPAETGIDRRQTLMAEETLPTSAAFSRAASYKPHTDDDLRDYEGSVSWSNGQPFTSAKRPQTLDDDIFSDSVKNINTSTLNSSALSFSKQTSNSLPEDRQSDLDVRYPTVDPKLITFDKAPRFIDAITGVGSDDQREFIDRSIHPSSRETRARHATFGTAPRFVEEKSEERRVVGTIASLNSHLHHNRRRSLLLQQQAIKSLSESIGSLSVKQG